MLRLLGSLGAFFVLVSLPAGEVHAEEWGGATEVEFAAAEGSGSGSFGCGQQTRLRYARAAVQVRHSERAASNPLGQGGTVLLGAAVEGARLTPIEAPTPDNGGQPLGESWLEGRVGGHLNVGYRHRYFGFEAGFGATFSPGGSPGSIFPNLEGSIGPRDVLFVVGGLGVSHLTAQLNYAYPYLGLGCRPFRALELETRWGLYQGGSVVVDRLDVIWRLRISERWAFRGGLAVGELTGDEFWSREASIGLQFSP